MYPGTQIPTLTQSTAVQYLGGDDGTEPEDWRLHGPSTFGVYADSMGIHDCSNLGLAAEVQWEMIDGVPCARAPMLELDPDDFRYVQTMGTPYDGMMALGDTGAIYEWDGDLGFFSSIVSAAKSVVKKVGSKIKSVIKKIPGGKYLIKLGSKIYKVASKLVKPLTKYVGKYATKLAPVAALIPGYGPAIAGALYMAGKVAKLMEKYGVSYKGKKGKVRKLKFKSGKKAKQFKRAMGKAAKKAKKTHKKKQKLAKMAGRRRKRMGARRADRVGKRRGVRALRRQARRLKRRSAAIPPRVDGLDGVDGLGRLPFFGRRVRSAMRRPTMGPFRRPGAMVRRRRKLAAMARRGMFPGFRR